MNITQKLSISLFLITIALIDYQLAKLSQRLILSLIPDFSYIWSLSIPWLLIGIVPIIAIKSKIFEIDFSFIRKNIRALVTYSLLIIVGLVLFVQIGVTQYFHSVRNPFIFFIITPIVEELIFRGWMYDLSKRIIKLSPVVVTAILFGLHHWQYFNYDITQFAIFQISYTFILGLLLGKIRQKSGVIYLSIFLHILINYVSYLL